MNNLFNVHIEYDIVVLSDREQDAIREARYHLNEEEPSYESANKIYNHSQIPDEWKFSIPYGYPISDKNCFQIMEEILENENREDIKREMDERQLKLPL